MDTTTHLLNTYPPHPLTLVRGQGTRVWDDTGRAYLDFCTGIATNALGHAHPHWVDTLHRQAATLAHTSNLYRNEPQTQLARHLNTRTNAGPGKLFFCNSGTEANEALIKLARLHGRHKTGGHEGRAHKIIVAAKAFHGRSFGSMSATPQEKIQNGYRPLLDGFITATLNDLDSFARHMDGHTAAVLIEVIQGEGGLTPATPDFLHALRALCTQRNILLLFDEIQTGAGRTGKYLAYQHHHPLTPDAYSLAKGLAGGFPIGAIWVAPAHTHLFTPGSHGSTFGGNPLACAAANAVQEIITRENLLEKITLQSPPWHDALRTLATQHPNHIKEIRGRGYLTGIALHHDTAPLINALRQAGLLTAPAGDNVIRLLPPLNVTPAELAESIHILEKTLATLP